MFRTKIPPPLYALFAGLLIFWLHRYLPEPAIPDTAVAYCAWLVSVPGGSLALWAAVTFRRARTTINPFAPSKASRLVTHGPYQITRNPMYLGLLLALTGWSAWLGSLSGFLVLPLFVAVVTYAQILPEEAALEGMFGQEYACYVQTVNRWIGRRKSSCAQNTRRFSRQA